MQEEEQKVRNDLIKLQTLSNMRKAQLEENKVAWEQKQQQFNQNLKLFNEFNKAYAPIAGTPEGEAMRKKLPQMPAFQNDPAFLDFAQNFTQMTADQAKKFGSAAQKFEEARRKNDKDGMFIAKSQAEAVAGESGMKSALKGFAEGVREPKPSALAVMLEEKKKLPPGSPDLQVYEGAIRKKSPAALSPGAMSATTRRKVEEEYRLNRGILGELSMVRKEMTPEMQKWFSIAGQGKKLWIEGQRKAGLEAGEKDYDRFIDLASTYLKPLIAQLHELYGSAFTSHEEDRAIATFPTAPEGILDFLKSDSGKTFVTKLDSWIGVIERAQKMREEMLNTNSVLPTEYSKGKMMYVLPSSEEVPGDISYDVQDLFELFKKDKPSLTDEEAMKLAKELAQAQR
jgi:hypothetical protein